jgi:hypothetical protein
MESNIEKMDKVLGVYEEQLFKNKYFVGDPFFTLLL